MFSPLHTRRPRLPSIFLRLHSSILVFVLCSLYPHHPRCPRTLLGTLSYLKDYMVSGYADCFPRLGVNAPRRQLTVRDIEKPGRRP